MYTFIASFDEGIYIAQVVSDTVPGAVESWAKLLIEERFLGEASEAMAKGALEDLEDYSKIEDRENVWCFTPYAEGYGVAIVNIVKTERE